MKHRWDVPTAFGACALCVLCVVAVAIPAHAYTDPNAIGLASQIITPLIIAASAGLTLFRKRIGAAFGAISRRLRRRANA